MHLPQATHARLCIRSYHAFKKYVSGANKWIDIVLTAFQYIEMKSEEGAIDLLFLGNMFV